MNQWQYAPLWNGEILGWTLAFSGGEIIVYRDVESSDEWLFTCNNLNINSFKMNTSNEEFAKERSVDIVKIKLLEMLASLKTAAK